MYKINDFIQETFKSIEEMAIGKADFNTVEQGILKKALSFGFMLTDYFLQLSQKIVQQEGTPVDSNGEKMKYKDHCTREILCVFGPVKINRAKYYSPLAKTFYPLDARLQLPECQESIFLQKLIGSRACEEDFRESVCLLNELLGLNLSGVQSQRITQKLGGEVDDYYESLELDNLAGEGASLCFQCDGKGVRVVEYERNPSGSIHAGQEKLRIVKGEKRGFKKMASVSVGYSFDPVARTVDEMLNTLHKKWNNKEKAEFKKQIKEQGQKPREAKNVHRRAFMCDQKKAIEYGIDNLIRRDPGGKKDIICLIDGGNGLEEGILKELEKRGLIARKKAIILDIIHVSEYIWKAGNAYLGEANPKRSNWVEIILRKLLNSQTEEVIAELKELAERKSLKKSAKNTILSVIRYFENHQHKMDYKAYLECGYPISTGLVEGCCGSLVKDRMEKSGARWTISGAQNVLNCRALKKNGDMDDFINKLNEKNRKRLYKGVA